MHAHPDPSKKVSLNKVPKNVRKEMLSDWHSVSKRTSDNPQSFPDVKTWAKENKLDWMHKIGSYIAHSTNRDSLEKILDSGSLKRVQDIVADGDETEVSVEPYKGLRTRRTLTPQKALDSLNDSGKGDKIFFTRNGYEKGYGDYVILKKYKDYKKHDKFTFIPNEVVTDKPVSVRNGSMIFAPKDQVRELSERYPNYHIRPKEALPINSFKLSDRVEKVKNEILEKIGSKKPLEDAREFGSSYLGLNVPGKSDKDYLVKVDSYEDAIDRSIDFLKKYPDFVASAYNNPNNGRLVYKGEIDGEDVDVVFKWSEDFDQMVQAFDRANENLTDERRQEIVEKKKSLSNAFFFPETRYKRYKAKVNKDLGVHFNYGG